MVGIEKGDAEEGDMVCYRYKGDYNIQSKFVDGVLYLTYQYANSSDLATDIDAMAKGVNGAIYWGEWPEHECLGRTNDEEGKYFGKELSNEHDTNGNSLPRIVPKFDFAKL